MHTSPGTDPGAGDAGGMNVVVRHQAEALGARGHLVDILTRRSSPEQPAESLLAPGVTLRVLDAGPARTITKSEHDELIDEFGAQVRATATAEPLWDVIHSHHWFSGMASLAVAREIGVPHVQSFHSIAADASTPLSYGERAESPARLAGELKLAAESDLVVTISTAEAETVVDRLRAGPERVRTVPPGVDSELFHPEAPGMAHTQPYALAAGRVHPLKGFDLAIETIAAMPERLRPELRIAGQASSDMQPYRNELARLADSLGVGDLVRFIGPQSRPELAALMRRARVVLIPSHSETYGLVSLEAAASGVPVVAATAGGLRKAVVNDVTGVLLESRAPDAWVDAVTRILTDTAYAERLSAAARERAEGYTWSRSAAALVEVYRTLIDDHATAEPGRRRAPASDV
ncbi:glycosyltransferase [Okibacterium endophyticum]